MLFKVKRGTHYRDGKVYKKGDTMESPIDQVAIYGKERFERDFEAEQKAGIVVIDSKPNIPPPVGVGVDKDGDDAEITSPSLSEYGKDVTSEFPTAEEMSVTVFEKSKWFTVVDADDNEVLNEKKLRRKDVEPFLEQYLDENEEDEDNED